MAIWAMIKHAMQKHLIFFERFTAQAIANMVIEWAENGMKVPPEKMALMDCVATRGIYGMIDSVN